MKTRLIFLLPLLWMLIGCSDSNSDSATLEISQSTFDNINSEGSIIKVSVTCNSTWRTISNQSWCIPNLQNAVILKVWECHEPVFVEELVVKSL